MISDLILVICKTSQSQLAVCKLQIKSHFLNCYHCVLSPVTTTITTKLDRNITSFTTYQIKKNKTKKTQMILHSGQQWCAIYIIYDSFTIVVLTMFQLALWSMSLIRTPR